MFFFEFPMKNNLAYVLYKIVVELRMIQLAYETGVFELFGIQVGCKICIALAILIIM